MMPRAFFWLLVLATPVRATEADVVWEPAQILDAEQIAESGAFVPLAIPTFFDNFRYPFLQDDESVVFIANDRGRRGGIGRHGLYRISKSGEVTKLAEPGDYFAGTSTRLTGLSGLRVDGGRAVFRCGLDDGGEGVGLWEDGTLFLLARTGDADGLDNIGYPGFAGNTVTFYVEKPAEKGALFGVDLAAFPRMPRKLVDTGAVMPGREEKFGSFGFQQEAEDGFAVFRGFAVGARELVGRTDGREQALGGVYRQDIRGTEPPRIVIDRTMHLPGGPPDATFAELQNALPRDGTVVVPSWSRDHSGIYYIGRDGQPRLVADTNTRIPELFEGSFTGFSKWAANCSPWVLFIAQAGSYRGLFAMNMERNELFLLLDNRTELGGKMVNDFELSSRPKLGEDIVLAIQFADESSGVFLLKFGDGWGKGIFRRGAVKAARGEPAPDERGDSAAAVDTGATGGGAASGSISAEILAEGSFRVEDKCCFYINLPKLKQASLKQGVSFLLPPDSSCARAGKAELIEPGLVLPARNDLGFGFRCVLFSEGERSCSVDGYDIFVEHPAIQGSDGQTQTSTTIPIRPCFKNGRAEDYALYLPNDEQWTIPGRWTVHIRKAGEVLLSRSFTLL